MTAIDFDSLRVRKKPTRRQASLYRRWVTYLTDSKLTDDEIHRRAASYAAAGQIPEGLAMDLATPRATDPRTRPSRRSRG